MHGPARQPPFRQKSHHVNGCGKTDSTANGRPALFLDFSTGDVLMLRTRAKVIWDGDEVLAFEGAQRLLRFEIDATIRFNGLLPFRSEGPPSYARELARTGTWTISE